MTAAIMISDGGNSSLRPPFPIVHIKVVPHRKQYLSKATKLWKRGDSLTALQYQVTQFVADFQLNSRPESPKKHSFGLPFLKYERQWRIFPLPYFGRLKKKLLRKISWEAPSLGRWV